MKLWNNECAQIGGRERILEREVHLGTWSIRRLVIWPQQKSGQEWPQQKSGHSYFLRFAEQCRAVVRKWVCVYTGSPAPTYRQPIMSMQSYTEPSALLQHLRGAWRCGTELDLASACLWRLHNCLTPSIWSLRPHFRIKHKLAFSLGLRNGLVHWDGHNYISLCVITETLG